VQPAAVFYGKFDRSLNVFGLGAEIYDASAQYKSAAQRLPWEDGLPDNIERSLRPYSDQFNGSYNSMCNAIEIGLARRSPKLPADEAQPDPEPAPESSS